MEGLRIKTLYGLNIIIQGKVTKEVFRNNEVIYYCKGESFPAEIVMEVFSDDKECK
jgi:hypothetical protein